MLNPEGTRHAPYSEQGCLLFVKLRQYRGAATVRIDTLSVPWHDTGTPGSKQLMLFETDAPGETISLYRMAPGCEVADHPHPGGEEIFVLEGGLEDQYGRYEAGCWGRSPAGSHHWAKSESGCLVYAKLGHLS
jgi:anti-sigma factor ChrR (cupin superfamily)